MSFWSKIGLAMLGSIAPGAALGALKVSSIKSQHDRTQKYIDQDMSIATDRMNTNQRLSRQNSAEALASRGLSPVAGAMMSGSAPTTVGEQVGADNAKQFGLEKTDLTNQYNRAKQENNSDAMNSYIGAATGAIGTAASLASGGAIPPSVVEQLAPTTPASSYSGGIGSGVSAAMLSGSGATEGDSQFGNINGTIDPLGHPSSPWYSGKQGTLNASPGLSNADFNVGDN